VFQSELNFAHINQPKQGDLKIPTTIYFMSDKYLFCIESILKSLNTAANILEKAQAWAKESGKSEEELLQARLAPDMLPLIKQITILSDNAKGVASRLSGTENPKYEDNESTFAELIERIKKTREFILSIDQQEYTDAHQQKIVMPYIPDKFQSAEDYARDYALPNFCFHLVTTYAILRNQGMPIGKMDYIGSLNLQDL